MSVDRKARRWIREISSQLEELLELLYPEDDSSGPGSDPPDGFALRPGKWEGVKAKMKQRARDMDDTNGV